jgi:hypothetical protein
LIRYEGREDRKMGNKKVDGKDLWVVIIALSGVIILLIVAVGILGVDLRMAKREGLLNGKTVIVDTRYGIVNALTLFENECNAHQQLLEGFTQGYELKCFNSTETSFYRLGFSKTHQLEGVGSG